jgi:protoporphyrinogen/coproporphyrinogen III oxidase
MQNSNQPSAIVVGSGLAGLAAGYRLQKAGWRVKLFETRDYPGGRAASDYRQGYIIDYGATGVSECYTEYLDLVRELGHGDKIVYASNNNGTLRNGHIYEIDGKHPWINGAKSRLFSWKSKLQMLRLFSDLRKMGDKMQFQDVSVGCAWDDESASSYAKRRLNQELHDYFIDPVLRALVTARPETMSKLEMMNALNGMFGNRLVAILGGMSFLPRTLAEHLNIQYETCVNEVIDHGSSVEVRYTDKHGSELAEQADACVLATLLPEAAKIFPECEPWVKPLNERLRYSPGLNVQLGYREKTKTDALMVMISSKEIPDITLVWLDHNKAPDRAPEGHSLITLTYDDAVVFDALKKDDSELIAQCSQIVETLFPELAGNLDLSMVYRWGAAVPMPETGVYTRMREVRQNLDNNQSRVQLAGDYLSCVGQNTAIHYGNEAAKKVNALWA